MTSPGRCLRVARLLAFAHDLDAQIRAGVYADLASAARAYGLTRARVTQIANLTLLAPAIQEEILAMPPVAVGRDPITERTLRPIVAEPVWERQVEMWSQIHQETPRAMSTFSGSSKALPCPRIGLRRPNPGGARERAVSPRNTG